MGKCLGEELKKRGYTSVHLVSHSLGAWVIDAAADKLTPEGIKTHLTFLDAYVPDGDKNGGSSEIVPHLRNNSFRTQAVACHIRVRYYRMPTIST